MKTLKSWKLNRDEVAISCGDNVGTIFKVYCAKILPLIKFDKPKETTVAISKSCFINSSKCKPSLSSKVTVRNYLVYPLSSYNTILATKRYPITHGTKLVLSIKSETNVDNISVRKKKGKE